MFASSLLKKFKSASGSLSEIFVEALFCLFSNSNKSKTENR